MRPGLGSGRVVSGNGYGLLGDLVVGVLGALVGSWVFGAVFGIVVGGILDRLVTAFVGAALLLWLIRLVAPGPG